MCNVEVFALIHDGLICSDASDALLRGAEAHLAEYGWQIQLLEKPLYGLQNEQIPELAPLYGNETKEITAYVPSIPLPPSNMSSHLQRDFIENELLKQARDDDLLIRRKNAQLNTVKGQPRSKATPVPLSQRDIIEKRLLKEARNEDLYYKRYLAESNTIEPQPGYKSTCTQSKGFPEEVQKQVFENMLKRHNRCIFDFTTTSVV